MTSQYVALLTAILGQLPVLLAVLRSHVKTRELTQGTTRDLSDRLAELQTRVATLEEELGVLYRAFVSERAAHGANARPLGRRLFGRR